jgi:glycosyltransferase involved in cell wall biosynthesis
MAAVSVIIPFGHRNDHEDRLFAWCYRRWEREFPEYELLVGDGGRPFNRSRARNRVAADAAGDVLVFINADTTWLDPLDIRRAVDRAAAGEWVLPAAYVETTEEYAIGVLNGTRPGMPPPGQYDRIRDMSCAGPQIVSAEHYRTLRRRVHRMGMGRLGVP